MSLWRFAEYLHPVAEQFRLSLGEGNTPLVQSRSIGPLAGLENLYFKLETTNPSGSYKDRFGAAAVSHMLSLGKRACVATSSGNTGAALAAYCAAAGLSCTIAVVETAPVGKLSQMMAYGARLLRVKGFGLDPGVTSECLQQLQAAGARPGFSLVISAFRYSPEGMTGVRSLGHELAEQLDGRLDHVFCPAGGGGLVAATGQAFAQLRQEGRLSGRACVECVQPEGNATIAGPLREGLRQARPVTCTSQISGLQVASVIDGDAAIEACRSSGGSGHLVSDEDTWLAQQRLCRQEGLFCEPAGAISVAAALQAAARGEIDRRATIVCLITGVGFKDPASIDRINADRDCPLIGLEELAPRLEQA